MPQTDQINQFSGKTRSQDQEIKENQNSLKIPSISLPKGGGAVKGIGEKFATNPVTGTGSMSIPNDTSPSRSGFGHSLRYHMIVDLGMAHTDLVGVYLFLQLLVKQIKVYQNIWMKLNQMYLFYLGAEDLVAVFEKDG